MQWMSVRKQGHEKLREIPLRRVPDEIIPQSRTLMQMQYKPI
jgi:hypothetical protein